MRTARHPLLVVVAVLALATAACSGPALAGEAAKPTGVATVSTPSLAAVPDELWGTWQPVEKVEGIGPLLLNLVFCAHGFAFYDDTSDSAIGRAWTAGVDQIALGIRGPCTSAATYTWKITAGKLVLRRRVRHVPAPRPIAWTKASDSTKPADSDVTQ